MHRRSFASEGTLPEATRRARKRVRGNAEAWVSTLQHKKTNLESRRLSGGNLRSGGDAVVGGDRAGVRRFWWRGYRVRRKRCTERNDYGFRVVCPVGIK